MNKRPSTLSAATRRLAGFAVVSVLSLIMLTGTVFAAGDQTQPPTDAGQPATPMSGLVSYTPSDVIPMPPALNCPDASSRGGTLGRIKMILHIQQAAFPNCPITGFYFDAPTAVQSSPQVAACLAAFTQLANAGLIPLNATINLVDGVGDTCVFVNGLVNVIPQQATPPLTAATQACLTAWQAAVLGGTVTGTGYWVITDLQGDTCLFNSGVLQALRTPADLTPAPQGAIGNCMLAWQQALLGGTAVVVGYFVLPDGSGDTCVFYNSLLQSVQLPGTFNLLPTFFI